MSYSEISQDKFIKETFNKIHSDLTTFLLETNYSSVPSIKLRNDLEEYTSKMKKNEKYHNNINIRNNSNFDIYNITYNSNNNFPKLIKIAKDPNLLFPNSLLYTTKQKPKNLFKSFVDININNIETEKNTKFLQKQKNNKNNLNLNLNINNKYNNKYYKYNNDNKSKKFFHQKFFDKYNNSIIKKSDILRGIYDMNIKKLIPRDADVSPMINLWGNPLKIIGNETKNIYKKNTSKNDVALSEINRLMPNKYSLNDFYKTQPHISNIKKNFNKLFLTTNDDNNNDNDTLNNFNNLLNTKNKTMYNNNNINSKENIFYDISNQKKIAISENNNNNINSTDNIKSKYSKTFYRTSINMKKVRKFYGFIKNLDMKNNLIIKYKDFELIKDSDFDKFKKENENNWKKIENILANYKILLEKLNMNKAFVDSNKLLKLIEYYKGKIFNITNKDLIICLNQDDLKEKGYDPNNESKIYEKIKIAFIIRIQKTYRKWLSYKKYLKIKFFIFFLIKVQKYIKGRFIRKKIKEKFEIYRNNIHNKYIEIYNKFKKEYTDIQKSPRYEIHINSLSYNEKYNKCLTDKYTMKETLQLSRLIKLIDPNLKIIYIIPYELPDEIISYYFSIMEKLGIKDIDTRVYFIIPEAGNYLPLNYSLSKLLFFSKKSLEKIKNIVKNQKCYIIPGIVGPIEEYLSVELNIPILMSPIDKINSIFNKSSIKDLLEINNIPFPISAWNIISEDEFYSSLVHLISTYPKINIWIFKTNFDNNALGIAYLNIDKIEIIKNFRKQMKNNKNISEKKLLKKKLFFDLKKSILKKHVIFAYPYIYKNWNEYLHHFLNHRGIIECCPTKGLSGIMGRPCIPILIEPNGIIKVLPSYEKINIDNFKNAINTSPQKCFDDNEMINLGKKLGNILYNENIIGYANIECILFHNGEEILYWCVDIKYGYTQIICDIQFCYFLYLQSLENNLILNNNNNSEKEIKNENVTISNNDIDKIDSFNYNIQFKESPVKENKENMEEFKEEKILKKIMTFSIPYITCGFIYVMKLKEILNKYKIGNIIYHIKKKEGIVLNLCDNLECGIFGMCGIISLDDYENILPELKLWRLIDVSINVIKEIAFSIEKHKVIDIINNYYKNKERSDKIDFQYILNKVKNKLKEKEFEQKKEEEKRRKLAGINVSS